MAYQFKKLIHLIQPQTTICMVVVLEDGEVFVDRGWERKQSKGIYLDCGLDCVKKACLDKD